MLCLTCTHDNSHPGPTCSECGSWIGYLADNRGYMPQLEALREGLDQSEIDAEEARSRLARLEMALQTLIAQMDETGANLAGLELDEGQQGTLGGFLMPVRQGLEKQLAIVVELDPKGGWSDQIMLDLQEAHIQVIRGNEGVAFLAESVMGMAVEAGADLGEVLGEFSGATATSGEEEDEPGEDG